MRGLSSKLQRRLRLILACLLLTLAVAPPPVGAITPAVAALVSAVDVEARARVSSSVAGPSACERTAHVASARRRAPARPNEASAALAAAYALHGSSREAAFDGRRLYLRHRALLC